MTTASPTAAPADLDELHALVAEDLADVDALIRTRLRSEVALINQLGAYIVSSGGKRLRPMVAVLCARALGYEGRRHLEVAAIVEFIHTATLLHDDVVDGSDMRRGRQTANLVWGNEASVLVGDFLYSRAFQMMVGVDDMRVMRILADATNTIAEGEVMQLVNCHDPDIGEARYLATIRNKTAKLFEAAGRLSAVLTGGDRRTEDGMGRYGMHLGTAYQLVDDALDYSADARELGKNVGDDLAEGNPTLPLLYTMWQGTERQAAVVREAIANGGRERLDEVVDAIESTGAITYTAGLAEAEAAKATEAIEVAPPSVYRDALAALAEFTVKRRS